MASFITSFIHTLEVLRTHPSFYNRARHGPLTPTHVLTTLYMTALATVSALLFTNLVVHGNTGGQIRGMVGAPAGSSVSAAFHTGFLYLYLYGLYAIQMLMSSAALMGANRSFGEMVTETLSRMNEW